MMDWEDLWHVVSAGTVVLLVIFVTVFIGALLFAPKNVDYYYLSQANGSRSATCVYAHWTWHTDELAFCTNDYQQALDFTAKANATLRVKP